MKIAVDDPFVRPERILQQGIKLFTRGLDPAGLPEKLVQVDDGDSCQCAEMTCEGGFSAAAAAEDEEAFDCIQYPPIGVQ